MGVAIGIDHRCIVGCRFQAFIDAAAESQPQTALHQWAGHREVGGDVVAEVAIFLHAAAETDAAAPAGADLAGDDVDHPTKGVGAIQRGGGSADDLDALDFVQRRDVVELVAAEVIGVDVAVVVLAFAVNQHQGVVGAHAADADAALSRLVGGFADVHPFQVADGIDQRQVGALLKVGAGDDRDAGRCMGQLLLEARCGDHDGVELARCALVRCWLGGFCGGRNGPGRQAGTHGARKHPCRVRYTRPQIETNHGTTPLR